MTDPQPFPFPRPHVQRLHSLIFLRELVVFALQVEDKANFHNE